MVANRRNRRSLQTDDEAARAAIAAVPIFDDPALFWGIDWREGLEKAEADIAAGRTRVFDSDEEFVAALDELAARADR